MKHLLCLFSSKPSSCKFQHYLPSLAERHKASFTKYYLGVDVRGLHSKGTFYLAHATVCSFIKSHLTYSSPRSAWLSYELEIFSVHPSLHTMSSLLMNSSSLSSNQPIHLRKNKSLVLYTSNRTETRDRLAVNSPMSKDSRGPFPYSRCCSEPSLGAGYNRTWLLCDQPLRQVPWYLPALCVCSGITE